MVDQFREDYDASATLDQYTYTYDRAGNLTGKDNELHSAFDKDYTYDDLDRLASSDRADNFDQSWTLDGLGNWSTFDDDGTSQTREANEANEITAISGGSIVPAYDDAGNMISGPSPDYAPDRFHFIYDAWNRLVGVYGDNAGEPGTPIEQYEYDGTGRRTVKVTTGEPGTIRHFYYNDQWQCVQENLANVYTGEINANPIRQNVWGDRYIDQLILRDRDSNLNGTLNERLYFLQDANYNVTSLVDTSGNVVERYVYTPYGEVTILDPDFSPDDYNDSDVSNTTLYTGREVDAETGLYYYRARYYHAQLGRFMNRDPIGYQGGDYNLHAYVGGSPAVQTDPFGLAFGDIWKPPRLEGVCASLWLYLHRNPPRPMLEWPIDNLSGSVVKGFTACYDQKAAPCVNEEELRGVRIISSSGVFGGRDFHLIRECTYEHELNHALVKDCATEVKYEPMMCYPAKYKDLYQDESYNECQAYLVQLGCMRRHLREPGSVLARVPVPPWIFAEKKTVSPAFSPGASQEGAENPPRTLGIVAPGATWAGIVSYCKGNPTCFENIRREFKNIHAQIQNHCDSNYIGPNVTLGIETGTNLNPPSDLWDHPIDALLYVYGLISYEDPGK